jgi:GTPase Era involved in 16S rRNA processing
MENDYPEKLRTMGQLEAYQDEIRRLSQIMESVPLWRPSAALNKECREGLRIINKLAEQFERKLVVTIIGPGGSGKSTLINALSGGEDHISPVGTDRPTTTDVVVCCSNSQDVDQIAEQFDPDAIRISSDHVLTNMENLIVIDTPDIDSTHRKDHIPLVNRAVELADVLICVFNAENPKTRDHVDFFNPYVRLFHGESLIGILNKCDRIDEQELKEAILPQFEQYILQAWDLPLQSLLCISARRHLKNPQWDEHARPKHDFDEFDKLKAMVQKTFNQPGYVVDRRLKNAQQIRDAIHDDVEKEVAQDSKFLKDARKRLKSIEKRSLEEAFREMKEEGSDQVLGVNVLLYQKMAHGWVGPVGWLIAIWARILIFGTGMMAIFRFGNPIRQILGILSAFRHFKEAKVSIAQSEKGERINIAVSRYRMTILKEWPSISEMLVNGRFENSVRKPDMSIWDSTQISDTLSSFWQESLDISIARASKKFSAIWLQLFFNLPAVGVLAHVTWLTARNYFAENYLSSDFFLHAFLTIIIVLFLSFFLFQVCVRLFAGSDRIIANAFERIKTYIDPLQDVSLNPILVQLDTILQLIPEALYTQSER